MKKLLKFYKREDKWYADIPEHTEEDNEMVLGSDRLLSTLAGKKSTIILNISDKFVDNYKLKFSLINHDEFGAEYLISGPLADEMNEIGFTIWICNVTHTIFGEHPNLIYLIDYR